MAEFTRDVCEIELTYTITDNVDVGRIIGICHALQPEVDVAGVEQATEFSDGTVDLQVTSAEDERIPWRHL